MKIVRIVLLLSLCVAAGCARRSRQPAAPLETPAAPAAPAPEVNLPPGLSFRVEPAEAEVIIDEKSYGPASALGHVPLPAGIYRVAVKARGYDTWRAEVSVGEKAEVLTVSLPARQ